jgi:gamma-glutamyltranspeptidase/glutathione hydrolase
VRQPGLGAPRPRGFTPDETVPEAAWVGVPALPVALITVLASLGTASVLRVAGPALSWARSRSPERARLLEAIARRGAPALVDDAVGGEVSAAAGRAARGLLTPEDLAAVRPGVVRCDEATLGPSGVLTAPWRVRAGSTGGPGGEGEGAPGVVFPDGANTQIIAAADGRGMAAVACYELAVEGVPVPSLGLVAPRGAEPVLRGKVRVTPGEPRAAAAPIALRSRRGVVDLVYGLASAGASEEALDALSAALDDLPTIPEALQSVRAGKPVAVLATRDTARALAGS